MTDKNTVRNKIGLRNWVIIWVVGLAGQLCWNVENQWFNTFVYAKIAPDPVIINWMDGAQAMSWFPYCTHSCAL